jgi:hypothetical protein
MSIDTRKVIERNDCSHWLLPSIMTDNREARCYLLHFDDVSSVGEEDFSLFVMQCYPFEDPTTTL